MISEAAATGSAEHFVLERTFDAPAELVYRAWTEPEHFKQWIAPEGYSIPFCEIDLRVGGKMKAAMRGPAGDHWFAGEYLELDPPRKIVSTDYFCDPEGNLLQPSEIGLPESWPAVNHVTITFREENGRTHVRVDQPMVTLAAAKALGADMGWTSSLDNLAELLKRMA